MNYDRKWNEDDHPRDTGGRFTEGDAGSGTGSGASRSRLIDLSNELAQMHTRGVNSSRLAEIIREVERMDTTDREIAEMVRLVRNQAHAQRSRSGPGRANEFESDRRPRATKTPPGAHGVYK